MSLEEKTGIIAIIIAMISTIVAAYAARQSKKATEISLKGIVSQLLINQIEKYSSEKMKDSLRLLIDYYKNHPLDFDTLFSKNQKNEPEVDEARRFVKFYFIENYNLFRTKLFNDEKIFMLMHNGNVSILLQIVEPIESKVASKNRDKKMFLFYRQKFPGALNEKIE